MRIWIKKSLAYCHLESAMKYSIGVSFTVSDFVGVAPGISASPSEDNMRYFNVMILGPTQSPYEGNLTY